MIKLLLFLLAVPSYREIVRTYESADGPVYYTTFVPGPLTSRTMYSSRVAQVPVYDSPGQGTSHTVPVGIAVKTITERGYWKRVVAKSPIIFSGWVHERNLVRVIARNTPAFCSSGARHHCAVLTEGMPVRVVGRSRTKIHVIPWGPVLPAVHLYVPFSAFTPSERTSSNSWNRLCLKRPFYMWRGRLVSIRMGSVILLDSKGEKVKVRLEADSPFLVGTRYSAGRFRVMWGSSSCTMMSGVVPQSSIVASFASYVSKYRLLREARFSYVPVELLRVLRPVPLFDAQDSRHPWAYLASDAGISWIDAYDRSIGRARIAIMMSSDNSGSVNRALSLLLPPYENVGTMFLPKEIQPFNYVSEKFKERIKYAMHRLLRNVSRSLGVVWLGYAAVSLMDLQIKTSRAGKSGSSSAVLP